MATTNNGSARYYGKYRGTVVDNVDLRQMGRLLVQVADVKGLVPSSWAMPCLPFRRQADGMVGSPADRRAGVWVEFEQGDPDYPIWTGCFYGSAAEPPVLALASPPGVPNIVLQTQGQNTLMISDVPGPTGGILLKTVSGALISISDTGIIISNGQGASITLTGPSVAINVAAMVIT